MTNQLVEIKNSHEQTIVEQAKRLQSELSRMKWSATLLLLLMCIIFISTTLLLRQGWPLCLAYVRAFAEAAMVGACADWFAVVALFRHPLGIPIPHTAIAAKHKNKIGDSLGLFVSNNFLTPEAISPVVNKFNIAAHLSKWLKNPTNAAVIAKRLPDLLPSLMQIVNHPEFKKIATELLSKFVDSINLSSIAARLLLLIREQGYESKAFDQALQLSKTWLVNHEEAIRESFAKGSSRWMPGWVDNKIFDAFYNELLQNIEKALDTPDHAWRASFSQWLLRLIEQLESDPEYFVKGEEIKAQLLNATLLDQYVENLSDEISRYLSKDLNRSESEIALRMQAWLIQMGEWIESDPTVSQRINMWGHDTLLRAIIPLRSKISDLISNVIAQWETKQWVEKLELQVGKDLQYIRINGTLVGGLVGLLIFTLSQAFIK